MCVKINIGVALSAALLLVGIANAPTYAAAPDTIVAVQAETLAPGVVREELTDLYTRLQASHYNLYARVSKRDYDRLFTRMRDGIDKPLTKTEAIALFQRFMAFGKIAHARIDAAGAAYGVYRGADGRAFPLAVRPVGRRLFITENSSGLTTIAPGDEIVSINGRTASQWLDTASQTTSADTRYMLGAMLEWSFTRFLWNELGDTPQFDLKLRRAGAAPFDVIVPARSRTYMTAAAAGQPPHLDLSWEKREARMLETGVAYLRPGPTYNVEGGEELMYDNTSFKAFIDQAFASFLAAGATDLIIDLRDNPGGDNSFSDIMVAWFASKPFRFNSTFKIKVSTATVASNAQRLAVAGNDPTGVSAEMAAAFEGVPEGGLIDFPISQAQPRAGQRFGGRVYALINRHSYSNTVAIAATIQDYGFGTVLGEETSDLATTYGAMEHFTLPRTGIVVGFPKAMIVRPNGDMRARGVTPDIVIATPVVESADDPVLHRAIDIVRSRQTPRG